MEEIVVFLTHHWMLAAALGLLVLGLIANELLQQRLGLPQLTPQAVVQLINHEGAKILDLRQASEFREGHITGSLNIPFGEELEKKVASIDKNHRLRLIIIDNHKHAGIKTCVALKRQGCPIAALQGGIEAWRAAGLPLVKVK